MDLSVFELRLQHAGALKAVYRLPVCGTAVVIAGENQFRLAGTGDAVLSRAVHIAVSVAGDCDRLLPGTHNGEIPLTMIGARKTVPSRMARIVPLGLFHIWERLYSCTRWALG